LLVEPDLSGDVVHSNALANELGHVLIAGHYHGFVTQRGHSHGNGADYVICLKVIRLKTRNADCFGDLPAVIDLRHQMVRHPGPVGFVSGEYCAAE
jgi:hypothetical protein